MIPGPKALLAAAALLLFSAACSWSQPPRIQDALFPPMAVQDPLFKRSTGKIYLLPQGLWTLTLDDPDNDFNTMLPGDLISFDPLDDATLTNIPAHTPTETPQHHIFAIVTKQSWGFLLQRLDDQPITRNAQGALTPISNPTSHDICIGTKNNITDKTTHDCLTQTPLSRFDIYAISSETSPDKITTTNRLLIQNQPDSDTLTMPVTRQALIYTDAQHAPKVFAPNRELPDQWIAIPSSQPALTPDQISIVSDKDCPDLENNSHILNGLTLHHQRLTEKLPHSKHPLEVEAAAFQHAADSMMWCTKDTTSIATPAIHHPLIIARDQYILGSSLLGLQPILLSTDQTQRALFAQIAALSARNHNVLADFALEILMQSLTASSTNAQQLAIQSMQLTASAGRPEAALRHGWLATQNTWNREGDPLYMLGQAAVFAAFDLNAEYTNRIQQFSKTLQASNDANLVAWLVYDDFRRQIATGNEIPLLQFEEIEKNLVTRKLDTWAITLRALALQQELQHQNPVKPAAIEILQKAFQDRNMASIWTAYIPQNASAPLPCPSSNAPDSTLSCSLDSFGRRLTSARNQNPENLIAKLRNSPRVELRDNFRLDQLNIPELNAQPALQVRLILAVFPLLSVHEKNTVLPQLSQSLANTISSDNNASPADTCKDLAQIQALGHELALRATTPDHAPRELAATRNATWLANSALPAACESLAKFEETVLEYTQSSGAQTSLITPFFDSILLHKINTQQDNADAIRTLGKLTTQIGSNKHGTTESGNNEPCLRFNLALAAALAKSGQLDEAQEHLLLSGKCAKSDKVLYTNSYNLILNYISYERSGRWPKNQPPQSPISSTPNPRNNRCTPLESDAFDIFQYLEPRIAQLATRFHLPQPETSTEFLQIRLASSAITQGEAAYQVARRTLAEARPAIAAKLLTEAREDFASSSHFLGLARIAFLEKNIFNDDLKAFLETDSTPNRNARTPNVMSKNIDQIQPSQLPTLLRNGLARPWLQQFDAATVEQRNKIPAHLLIAASMLVEELPQTLIRLQSIPDDAITPPLADFCNPQNLNARLIQ